LLSGYESAVDNIGWNRLTPLILQSWQAVINRQPEQSFSLLESGGNKAFQRSLTALKPRTY
jgi:hypothetical protein